MASLAEKRQIDALLAKYRTSAERDQRRLDELEEQNAYLGDTIRSSLVVPTSAFATSYVRAYYGDEASSICGIPIDAAVGLLLKGFAALLGLSSNKEAQTAAKVAHDVATGALASWPTSLGAEFGAKKRAEKPVPVPLPNMGAEKRLPISSRALTHEDLAAIEAAMGLPPPAHSPVRSPIPAQQQQMTGAVAPLQETPVRVSRPMTHEELAAITAPMALNTQPVMPVQPLPPTPLPAPAPMPLANPVQQTVSPPPRIEVAAANVPVQMPPMAMPQHAPLNVPPPLVATAKFESPPAVPSMPTKPYRFTQRWAVDPEADMRALLQSVGAPSDPNTVMHLLSHENPGEAFNTIVRRARAPA